MKEDQHRPGAIIEGDCFESWCTAGGKVKVEGSATCDAPRDRVWSVLLNPEALKHCVSGCGSLPASGENLVDPWIPVYEEQL